MIASVSPVNCDSDRSNVLVNDDIPVSPVGNSSGTQPLILTCYDVIPSSRPQFLQSVLRECRGFGNMAPRGVIPRRSNHQAGKGQEGDGEDDQGYQDFNKCETFRFMAESQCQPPESGFFIGVAKAIPRPFWTCGVFGGRGMKEIS